MNKETTNNLPIIIGISGATGAIYGIALLKALKELQQKTILVVSEMGFYTIFEELGIKAKEVIALADEYYVNTDFNAPIASGSFLTKGMIVAPCSIKSLSGIAHSYDSNLLTRSADVCLKEKRKLVLMLRETPLHLGHIELMAKVVSYGGIIAPPLPAFYNKPETIEDIVNHSIFRVLDLLDIPHNNLKRWGKKND